MNNQVQYSNISVPFTFFLNILFEFYSQLVDIDGGAIKATQENVTK